jgi:transaldolase
MDAYLAGLEQARSSGHDLSQIHSVASFFPSRVDTEIDKRLRAIGSADAKTLLGRAAIAHARLVYQAYEQTFAGERWAALAAAGATKQRPLWASAGTIDLHHDDARYLLSLAAPGTVYAATEKTINSAAADQVIGLNTMGANYADAAQLFGDLDTVGIDLGEVFEILETEGVIRCTHAWIEMLGSVGQQLARIPTHR